MNKREKGFVPVIMLIGLMVLIVAASAASYYILKKAGKAPVPSVTVSTPLPISDSDAVEDMEKELDSTQLDDLDKDFEELESSAASL